MRRRNEDALRLDVARGIAIVADGMGGHPAGDLASALAAEASLSRLQRLVDGAASRIPSSDELRAGMAEAVMSADVAVREKASTSASLQGMGTTLTALLALAEAEKAVIGHVGDSRAYRVRERSLRLLTRDDTWVQDQIDAGRLTDQEARRHPYGSVLTQALGLDRPPRVDVLEEELRAGDLYLLCSDGLVAMLRDTDIERLLGEHVAEGVEEAAAALVDEANALGGVDNVTVALLLARPPEN